MEKVMAITYLAAGIVMGELAFQCPILDTLKSLISSYKSQWEKLTNPNQDKKQIQKQLLAESYSQFKYLSKLVVLILVLVLPFFLLFLLWNQRGFEWYHLISSPTNIALSTVGVFIPVLIRRLRQ